MATDVFRLDATGLRCQLVLTLREVDKLTYAEIGRRLGVSRGRAEQIYHKAVRILRNERRREAPYIVAALTSVLEKAGQIKLDNSVKECRMSASTPEGKVKKKVTDLLKSHKIWYFFPANNGFGKGGIPDIIAIVDGIFVGIEVKADRTKKPTELQVKCGREIRESGAEWFLVCDDVSLRQVEQYITRNR